MRMMHSPVGPGAAARRGVPGLTHHAHAVPPCSSLGVAVTEGHCWRGEKLRPLSARRLTPGFSIAIALGTPCVCSAPFTRVGQYSDCSEAFTSLLQLCLYHQLAASASLNQSDRAQGRTVFKFRTVLSQILSQKLTRHLIPTPLYPQPVHDSLQHLPPRKVSSSA